MMLDTFALEVTTPRGIRALRRSRHHPIVALSPPVLGSDNLLGEIGRDADDLPDVAPEMAHWMRLTSRRSMPRSRMQPILQSCAHNPELRVALRQLSLWPHRTTGGRLSV